MKRLVRTMAAALAVVAGVGFLEAGAQEPASIMAFGLTGNPAVIDQAAKTIAWTVPPRTAVTNLAPVYALSSGRCVPASGSAQDFSSPVVYTVSDGEITNVYTVTVAFTAPGLKFRTYNGVDGEPYLNPISNLMALQPSGTGMQVANIDYHGNFQASFPGFTGGDNISILWEGWFDVAADGQGAYTFATASDDGSVVYMDLNDDGDFADAGELIVDNNFYQGNTMRSGTVTLGMDAVRIAIGFYQGGGGSDMTARFGKGAGIAWDAMAPVNGISAHFYPERPVVPTAPYGLTAVPGDGRVTLAWTAFPGATGYRVKRALASGGPYDLIATPAENSYTDTAVTNNTAYYYVVSAMTDAVESGDSREAAATPATVDAGASTVAAFPPAVWADSSSAAKITVTLKDAGGNPVPDKEVTLSHTAGPGSPVIMTVTGTTDVAGAAIFTVTSGTEGVEEFTATDVSDGALAITQTAAVTFVTRPPDLTNYVAGASVIMTWDFTNSANPGWQRGRTTALTDAGIKLGSAVPDLPDHGAMVGMIYVGAPAALTYVNSGVEMTYYAPNLPAPTDGYEFLFMWTDTTPRYGFGVLAGGGQLRGQARTQMINLSDSNWQVPIDPVLGVGLDGLHTMALVRNGDGTIDTYLDGVKVNTRTGAIPAAVKPQYISIGMNVNGNMYMPFGSLISQVRAFNVIPQVKPVDPVRSTVVASPASAWADGSAVSLITVTLRDADGLLVPGKDVSLAVTSGPGSAVITTLTGTTGGDGQAVFAVSSAAAEADEFTATDTTDALALDQKPTVNFVEPGFVAVSVNIDTDAREGLVGPAGGLGMAWVQAPLSASGPIAVSGLLDTNGVGTSMGFTCDAGMVGNWGSPSLVMLQGGAFHFGGESPPINLVITNIPAGRKYDLYLVSYLYSEGSKATFTTANTTTNGAVQYCNNGGPAGNSTTWVQGVNYALFQGMEPDSSNRISVTMSRTDLGVYALFNGFQLMEVIPPPPRMFPGAILTVR